MAQKRLDLAELCEHSAWNEPLRLRALQAAIGQQLRAQIELPQELDHRLLTILKQLDAPQEASVQGAVLAPMLSAEITAAGTSGSPATDRR